MRAHIVSSPKAQDRIAKWECRVGDDNDAAQNPRATDVSAHNLNTRIRTDAWRPLLDRYLQGWAEANPTKIFVAAAKGYRFNDPLVGRFSRWSIPLYFEHLRTRFACSDQTPARDLALVIDGPIDGPLCLGQVRFFREAPRLGLTGISFITIGEHGVIAETVTYDPNLALEVLRARPEAYEQARHA